MKIILNYSQQNPRKQLISFISIFCITFLISLTIQGVIIGSSGVYNNVEKLHPIILKIILIVSQLTIFLLPALFFGYYYSEKTLFSNLQITPIGIKNYVIIMGIFIIGYPFIMWIGELNQLIHFSGKLQFLQDYLNRQNGDLHKSLKQILVMNNIVDCGVMILIIGVLPAICEELFFRSVLHNIIYRMNKKIWVSIIVSSCIFSFVHFHFLGFLPRFVIGFILAFFLHYNNSILPSMFIHFVNNTIPIIIIYKGGVDKLDNNLEGIHIHPIGGIISGLVLIAGCYILYKKRRTNNA